MAADLSALRTSLTKLLGDRLVGAEEGLGELTVVVGAAEMLDALTQLRDAAGFEQMIDLCGVDYSTYGDGARECQRFAVVYHLLSVVHNARLRVRIFAEEDDFPVLESVTDIWSCANWYEREAFDLYGIVFSGLAPYPDRLWFCRQPVPQGFPVVRSCGNALRPGAAARGVSAGIGRAARSDAARDT